MYSFRYHRPETPDQALELFRQGEDPAYLAGGHTLLPTLKGRLAAPSDLIDLKALSALNFIRVTPGMISIGAATPHADVAGSEEIRAVLPALSGLAGAIGDIHVRNFGTIGGSLANNDPAADYPSALLGLGGTVVTDRREIPADDYFQGLFTTALEPGELIMRLDLPLPRSAGYAKFRHPASRYAMAGVFVAAVDDGVRVAITGAGDDGVFRWREAEQRLTARLAPAALDGLTISEAGLMIDMHATARYRAHLVSVMARHAVEAMDGAFIVP